MPDAGKNVADANYFYYQIDQIQQFTMEALGVAVLFDLLNNLVESLISGDEKQNNHDEVPLNGELIVR